MRYHEIIETITYRETTGRETVDLINQLDPNMWRREGQRIKYLDRSEAEHEYHFVALDGEYIAGMAGVQQNPYDANELWIKFISVDPKYQGRGIARSLLERIYRHANDNGLTVISSTPTDDGERLKHIHDEMREKYHISENVFRPDHIPQLYHGTTDKHLGEIMRRGLMPQETPHSIMRGNNSTISDYTIHNVYLTDDPNLAMMYAKSQARHQGGNPIVFSVGIPDPYKLVADDDHILDIAKKKMKSYIDKNYDDDKAMSGDYKPPLIDDFVEQISKEELFTRSLKQTDSLGYKGRIPASFIDIHKYPHMEDHS